MADKKSKEKKKILIATDSILPRWDGIARFIDEIVPRLAKRFEITLVSPDYGTTPLYPAKIVKFPLSTFKVGGFVLAKPDKQKMRELVQKHDIVFTQTIGPIGAMAIRFGRKYDKRVVSFIHSIEWQLFAKSLPFGQRIITKILRLLVPRLYNKTDVLICPSEHIERILRRRRIGKKHAIVHLGVNTTRFSPGPSKKSLLHLQDYIVIGYLGRTSREKDLGTLYKAFRTLYEENKQIHLLIVGGKVDWNDMRGITVVDQVDDPQTYFRMMDIYVLPSLTETTSLTTIEAMASGVCVVVTPVGHIISYINDRKNGVLFPKGDVEYLASELKSLCTDSARRTKLGKAARQTALTFSWHKTGEELIKVLTLLD